MTGDDDLIRRGEVLELRDAIADSIGAKPGSWIHSALCKYANAIAALPAVQPAAVAPDVALAALRAERDTLRARPADVAAAARMLLSALPNPLFDTLKPEMMGEIKESVYDYTDADDNPVYIDRMLPWDTIKQVIRLALRALATPSSPVRAEDKA